MVPSGNSDAKDIGPVINADEIIVPVAHKTRRAPRALIADWMRLRTLDPEITYSEAARKLGIARQHLHRTINKATQEGWLRFDDPLARIEHQIIPKVIDNLAQFLDEKDKGVTLEAAKGTIFKTYQEAKANPQAVQSTILAIRIEMPESQGGGPQVIEGQVVGRPKIQIEEEEDAEGTGSETEAAGK